MHRLAIPTVCIVLTQAIFGTAHAQTPVPLAAHHQHLMSQSSAELGHITLDEVKLPPELQSLIDDRGALKDMAALMQRYTEDAVMLHLGNYWIRGRENIRSFLGGNGYYRLAPLSYHAADSMAFVSGTFKRGPRDAETWFRNFHITAVKGNDGVWRIASESFTSEPAYVPKAYTADELILDLDEAGIRRGVVLSVAYWLGSPSNAHLADAKERMRAENDWVAAQVAKYPDRLIAFCSVNPLSDYAIQEIERCPSKGFKGLKLHLGNSRVNLHDPIHLAAVQGVFATANRLKLPIVVHAWPYLQKTNEYAKVFLEQVLPHAPDIYVQLAHLGGDGNYTLEHDAELGILANAVQARDPRTKKLIFDICQTTSIDQPGDVSALIAKRLRQIGLDRIYFGTDMPPMPSSRASWAAVVGTLGLTNEEIKTIATNVAPYLKP